MKAKLFTYLFFSLCFSQVFSQELSDMNLAQKNTKLTSLNDVNFNYSKETIINQFSFLNIGSDAFTIQVINYAISDFSISINTRVEEELPYEIDTYDYEGFYYLDIGCSYNFGNFNFDLTLENILNFNSKDFSIDPNLETSNGIINAFYLSHETDALISLAVAYNF